MAACVRWVVVRVGFGILSWLGKYPMDGNWSFRRSVSRNGSTFVTMKDETFQDSLHAYFWNDQVNAGRTKCIA